MGCDTGAAVASIDTWLFVLSLLLPCDDLGALGRRGGCSLRPHSWPIACICHISAAVLPQSRCDRGVYTMVVNQTVTGEVVGS